MIESQVSEVGTDRQSVPRALIHSLRTPLNQIIGYSEMLIEQAVQAGNGVAIPDLQKVHAAGRELLGVIETSFDPIQDSSAHPERPSDHTVLGDLSDAHEEDLLGAIEPPEAFGATPPRLLVVDDIEANRDILSRRLTRQGYQVATANDGRMALEMLSEGTFDLVLLDIMMPEIDGYEVLRRLKADERLKHVPVIMISALNEFTAVGKCIEMGAEDYLPKPFNPILLKARISASLGKKLAHDREVRLFEELQQNFKRLEESEKLRDDLTNMIIHDLRTPLSSVIAGMQTIEMLGDLNEDQKEMKDIAVFGGNTLLGLINDVLDVEKTESGTMELDCSNLSPATLVSVAIDQAVALAESRGLELVQNVDANLPELRGDEHKLVRSLVNLLGNAIKFTPTGGVVTTCARLSEDKQSIVFSVTDTGEGIPSESFERIFEKFGQVESRQGGRSMSTGLGLTFCKLAVEAHGGHIGVKSEPGEGSTFWFTIPLPAE